MVLMEQDKRPIKEEDVERKHPRLKKGISGKEKGRQKWGKKEEKRIRG